MAPEPVNRVSLSNESDGTVVADSHSEPSILDRVELCVKDLATRKYRRVAVSFGRMEFREAVKFLVSLVEVFRSYYRIVEKCATKGEYDDIEFVANAVLLNVVSKAPIVEEEETYFCSVTRSIDELADAVASILISIVIGELEERGKHTLAQAVEKTIRTDNAMEMMYTARSIIINYLRDLIS